MARKPVRRIYFDKRTNRFRGDNGRFISRKDIIYDERVGQFRYRGRYVSVDVKPTDIKTSSGVPLFRLPTDQYIFFRTIRKEEPKRPAIEFISVDITDYFITYYYDGYFYFELREGREADLYDLIRTLTSTIVAPNIRIYFFASIETIRGETEYVSSITATTTTYAEISSILEDFKEKIEALLNGILYHKDFDPETLIIQLVIKYW